MTDARGEPVGAVSTQPGTDDERILIQSALPQEKSPPLRVLVAPWGEVRSLNGTFVVDGVAAGAVIEAFRAHATDIPIDYEHQSLGGEYSSPNGQAPAAGWIRGLTAVEPDETTEQPGLYAEVDWTESAKKKLSAKEYRYLSPVVLVRKSDRRMIALHSAALTNKPAIVGMTPILNRELLPVKDGDGADVSGGDVQEAVEVLRNRLGLPTDNDVKSVLAAADARLALLMTEGARREAEDRVNAAMQAGKLTAAQRQWAVSLAMKDLGAFEEWLATAPVLVLPGRIAPPGGESAGNRQKSAVIASARSAFRSQPELASITSEEAWIQEAVREQGLDSVAD